MLSTHIQSLQRNGTNKYPICTKRVAALCSCEIFTKPTYILFAYLSKLY